MVFCKRNSRNLLAVSWIITYLCAITDNAVTAQTSLGNFSMIAHNLAGEVVVLSDRILEVRGLVYDGQAPAVYFWADTNAVPSTGGYRLNDGSPTNGCGKIPIAQAADGSETYRVEFPSGVTILDLLGGSISVWCEEFDVSFGEVVIPTTFSNDLTSTSGPDLECASSVEEPVASPTSGAAAAPTAVSSPTSAAAPTTVALPTSVAAPTAVASPMPGAAAPTVVESPTSVAAELSLATFTTVSHNVEGEVVLLSDRVMEVRGFVYDGQAPAVYFWADTNSVPSMNGYRLNDGSPTNGCGLIPLAQAADGSETYRIEFPNNLTISDLLGGSISVWCEEFHVNFGDLIVPSTLTGVPTNGNGLDLECASRVEGPVVSPTSDAAAPTAVALPTPVTAPTAVASPTSVASPSASEDGPLLIGNFTTRAHEVTGSVYVVSDRIIEIRGFTYDGEGPAAYFYVDTAAEPTANGVRINDSEGGSAPSCGMVPLLSASSNDVYRAEFPNGTSIQDFLGGSFSVWCEVAAANFGEVVIPTTLPASVSAVDDSTLIACASSAVTEDPDLFATPVGYNCEPLSDAFQVRWQIEGDNMLVELIGIIDEEEYLSFGVSGLPDSTFMIGADVVVADTYEGVYRARDFYMNSRSQCSSGTGVCPDSDMAGAVDDVSVSSVTGDRNQGVTIVRYTKPLVTSDAVGIDVPISVVAGEITFVSWAIGPISPETGNPQFHSAYPRDDVSFEFGRDVVDNCEPIINGSPEEATEPSSTSFEIPMLQDVTEFVANIGPSGGERGYMGITGQTSWGIAWYINDLLVPVIEMKRGTTYTFTVHGGDNPSNGAEYHPFYITSSPFGGYRPLNATSRSLETVYAGIEDIVYGDDGSVQNFTNPFVAPICLYKTTDESTDVNVAGTFPDFFDSLDVSCKENGSIMDSGFTFTFTPNKTTPDLIYYHCVTHRNLGWKIVVVDANGLSPPSSPTGQSPSSPIAAPSIAATSEGHSIDLCHSTVTSLILLLLRLFF